MFVSRVKNNTEDCWRGTVNKGRGGSNKAYLLSEDIILSVKGAGNSISELLTVGISTLEFKTHSWFLF